MCVFLLRQAHELIQQDDGNESGATWEKLDVPDELKFEGNLEHVSQQIGEKESTMQNAEILSDGALKDSVQVEMDKLDADEETDRVCTRKKALCTPLHHLCFCFSWLVWTKDKRKTRVTQPC